ncbi:MAG TPA: PAS domain S-box protein [Pirellulales bacterium]|nr:PAS domain S-box protein [Pirellulales bacterium]
MTHLKQDQELERLRAVEARFRRIMESNMIGIYFYEPSGVITEANDAFLQMVAYPAEEVRSGRLTWSRITPSDQADQVAQALADLQAHGICGPYEQEYVRSDGGRLTVLVVGAALDADPSRGVVFALDISRGKQAERSLAASERRFRAFMDNNPAVAFIKNTEGHRIYFNRRYRQMFQTGSEELLGATDFDLFPLEVAERTRASDLAVLKSREAMRTIERVPTPDGVLRHWLVFKFPIEETPGEWFVGGVAVDITEQKQVEEELRRARDELELHVSQRTESLVTINTQLHQEIARRELSEAALRRDREFLQHLLSLSESDRQLVAYEIHDGLVQYVTASLMHLDSLVQLLPPEVPRQNLDVSRSLLRDALGEARRLISGLRPPILDEAGVVAAIDYMVREQADDCQIEFTHDVRSARFPPLIESALFRVCQEALTNVRKHSGASRATIDLREENGVVRLAISDNGVGFDAGSVTGQTFGLQGMRERARLLGGHTVIDSAPAMGTRITVELPIQTTAG